MPRITADRIQRNIKQDPSGCWLWTGGKSTGGYGLIHTGGNKHSYVHRHVCSIFWGPQPDGKPLVLHSCDIPNCINPEHLRWGSPADNTRDMFKRGRNPDRTKTHCKRGHKLSGDNVKLVGRRKARACKACYIAYYKANRDDMNKRALKWAHANKEKRKEICRRYYLKKRART